MDGFYVAKIQKLSDRRPGEEKTSYTANEKIAGGEDVKVDEAGNGVQVSDEDGASSSDEATPSKKKQVKESAASKKRKKGQKDQVKKKPKVVQKVSVPPTKPKQKTKKLNAKMTKPRRRRQSDE
jgi:hypothetical protein